MNGLNSVCRRGFLCAIFFAWPLFWLFKVSCRAESEDSKRYNVVIVSLNAARADHCTPYGYGRDTTPSLQALSEEGVIFENAFAQSHWTLPSLASMLTSTYVHVHGVYSRDNRLAEKELTLAEILKKYDYRTAAFVGGLDTAAGYGLAQGFDSYSDGTGKKPMGSLRDIVPPAIQWVRQHRGERFFLFIQGYDVHPPFALTREYRGMYDKGYTGILAGREIDYALLRGIRGNTVFLEGRKRNLGEPDIGHIIACYDAALTCADSWVGVLLKELKDLGLFGKTMIVITAEHGEALGDHGTFDRFESGYLYDELLRVPLVIAVPDNRAKVKRITCQVQLIDIMPTILDVLAIPVNKEAQGKSLVPLLEEAGTGGCGEFVYAEAQKDAWAMRSSRWKLICERGEYQLYDLAVDGLEQTNIAAENTGVVYELVQRFSEWDRRTRQGREIISDTIELPDEMKMNLKEAGYW